MKYKTVDAFTECPVSNVFDHGRVPQPSFIGVGGKSLLADDIAAKDMSGARHFRHRAPFFEAQPRPAFRHWLYSFAAITNIAGWLARISFNRQSQAMFARRLTYGGCIILQQQIADSLPKIPQKSLGNFEAVHDLPRKDQHIRQQVVTAHPLKVCPHRWRPILNTGFPTVNVRGNKRLAGEGTNGFNDASHERFKLDQRRSSAELVRFQSQSTGWRRMVIDASRGMSKSKYGPVARRQFAPEKTVLVHLFGHIKNAGF